MDIIKEVARKYGVSAPDLCGPRKHGPRNIQRIRHEAIARVAMERPDMSLPQIGRIFGGRDHTTIMASLGVMGVRAPRRRYVGRKT
jgi:chromosomal replication initiator protein